MTITYFAIAGDIMLLFVMVTMGFDVMGEFRLPALIGRAGLGWSRTVVWSATLKRGKGMVGEWQIMGISSLNDMSKCVASLAHQYPQCRLHIDCHISSAV